MYGFGFAVEIGEDDWDITAKFPDDLTTNAARWRQGFGLGDHGVAFYFALALRDGVPHGDTLGAHREPVARRFDIAADDDLAVVGLKRRPNLKFRKRRIRVFTHGCRCFYKFLF